jgi:uncharacterized membrane protein
METPYRISIRTLFGTAWQHFKTRPWFYIGITLFSIGLSIVFRDASDRIHENSSFLASIFSLVTFFIESVVMLGYISILLRSLSGHATKFSDLFGAGPLFWKFIVTAFLFGLMLFLGTLALLIPGLIVLSTFYFSTVLVVDRRLRPIAALRESARMTKGIRLQVFQFILSFLIINFVGALGFGIGLLVTYPISMIASVLLYRELTLRTVPTEEVSSLT